MRLTLTSAILVLTSAALLAGCGATLPSQQVDLDPLILRPDGEGSVEVVDARELFKEASDDYQRSRFADALRKFRLVTSLFPKSRYAPHAQFNAGLALQRLDRPEEGLAVFQKAAHGLEGSKDEWDARYQVTVCLEDLKRWEALGAETEPLIVPGRLPITQRIEVIVRSGLSHYHLGRLAEAEEAFILALKLRRENAGVPGLESNYHVAQAQYLIGEIYRGLFATIRFRLPVETMKRDLQDKSSFFLKGQSAFLRCIRLNNNYWSVAAGYQLGRLYEAFYDDMMRAEVPPELDRDDREIYYDELKRHIKPLVVRAVDIYERNLGMSDRFGRGTEWTQKTQASLDRMRDILRKEFADLTEE